MAEAVVDVKVEPAEVTGAAPSVANETSTAKEPEVKAEPKLTDSVEEKDEPKDKDNPLYLRMSKYRTQRNEAREVLTKLKDFGIESPEHAEFLQKEAQRIQNLEDNLREAPDQAMEEILTAYPEAQEAITSTILTREFSKDPMGFEKKLYALDPDAHVSMIGNAVKRVLLKSAENPQYADQADILRSLAQNFGDNRLPREIKQAPKAPQVADEKWEFFEDQVSTENTERLTGKINEAIAAHNAQFRTDSQKEKFIQRVRDSISKALDADAVYVRQRDQVQDPRRGLTKAQRQQAVELFSKFSTMNGRVAKAVAEEMDLMNLPTKQPEKVERREVNTVGVAPSGQITQSDKDRIWSEITKSGLSGTGAKQEYFKRMREARGGK